MRPLEIPYYCYSVRLGGKGSPPPSVDWKFQRRANEAYKRNALSVQRSNGAGNQDPDQLIKHIAAEGEAHILWEVAKKVIFPVDLLIKAS